MAARFRGRANDLRLQIGVLERLMAAGQDQQKTEQIAEQAQALWHVQGPFKKIIRKFYFSPGIFPRLSGDFQTARQSWQTLLDRLPRQAKQLAFCKPSWISWPLKS